MKNTLFRMLTTIFVAFGCLSMYIVVHEFTHLMGSTNPRGICIGLCGEQPSPQSQSSVLGLAFADKFLVGDEVTPTLVGIAFCGLMLGAWIYCGTKKVEK